MDERAAHSFSLVAGGPFYGLRLRLGLLSPPLEHLWRLTTALTAIAWLPPLILAAVHGGSAGAAGYLRDAEVEVRFLVCLPILVLMERLVHERLGPLPGYFLGRGLVAPEQRPAFDAAFAGALRLRDGPAEIILLVLIYLLRASPWDVTFVAAGRSWYYLWVSIPLYQFVLVRWAWRLLIWIKVLWHMAFLRLALLPAHPDKAGGLGFLADAVVAFEPLVFVQSAIVAAYIATTTQPAAWRFNGDLAAIFLGSAAVLLGPLALFAIPLAAARRRASREYGDLFARCLRAFEARWVGKPDGDALPSPTELQGQGSISASYDPVKVMRPVPFGLDSLARLAIWALAPWIPIALAAGYALEVVKLLLKALW